MVDESNTPSHFMSGVEAAVAASQAGLGRHTKNSTPVDYPFNAKLLFLKIIGELISNSLAFFRGFFPLPFFGALFLPVAVILMSLLISA